MKRGKIILILILMSISISILVYSFAYTTTTHTGDDSSYLMISEIVFGLNDAVESINLEQQTPTIDKFGVLNKSFSFSITNTSNKDMDYTVRLIDKDVISTIPNEEIRYQLTVNGNVQEIQNLAGGGSLDSGSIAKGDTIEYSLIVWLDYNATSTGGVWEKVASVEAGTDNLDGSGANPPILLSNMIPVYYDAKDDVWRKADRTNSNSNHKWYDYDDRMWANAVTINERRVYEEKITTNQTVNIENGKGYVSDNVHLDNTSSGMKIKISTPVNGAVFKMDYSVSSDSGDYLGISVNKFEVVSQLKGEKSGTFLINLIANRTYEISVYYSKSGWGYSGDDRAMISYSTTDGVNVEISSTSNYPWKYFDENMNKVASSYEYDSSTNTYTLNDYSTENLSSDLNDMYICDNPIKNQCETMYKIKQVNESITKVDVYSSTSQKITKRNDYINDEVGEIVSIDDIASFYVWIPRFKYDLFENGSPKLVNVTFEKGIENTGTMKCRIMTGNEVCTGDKISYTHPAFTFGNEELTGYWINKFEVGPENNTNCYKNEHEVFCDINNLPLVSKPNYRTLSQTSLSSLFYSIRGMELDNNIYGFENTGVKLNGDGSIQGDKNDYDIHLSKNFELAAITYLTYSKYGNYNNLSYEGVDIVDNYPDSSLTTGNIYGIYDINSKKDENVMLNVLYTDGKMQLSGYGFSDQIINKYYDGYGYYSNEGNFKPFYGSAAIQSEFKGFTNDNLSSSRYPKIFAKRTSLTKIENQSYSGTRGASGRAVITVNDIYITKW